MIASRAKDIEDVRTIILKNPSYGASIIDLWLMELDMSEENFSAIFKKIVDEIK